MDCNMRSPFHWDWDNLFMTTTENHKKHLSTDWEIEKGEGLESIVPYFSTLDTSTNFCYTAVSKTSLSSPTLKHCKPGDLVHVKDSTGAESDLCLKLGKRTYSEDLWARNCNDTSAVSMKVLTPSVVARKKPKSSGQSLQVPRCQIDGCELDLSSAKDYHRKHRVCENHSKCPKVFVDGLERRFCQQCSRLHAVSEFDEKKRSCRKRLSHHNARRRKPQGVFPLNPERVYDRRQHTNMLWNGLSLNTKSEEKYAWGTTYDTSPTQTESGFTLSFQRGHGSEQLFASSSSCYFSAFQTSEGFPAAKSNSQLPVKGVGECSAGLRESHDFYSALSLLSTSSTSPGTKHNPLVEAPPVFGTLPTHFI